MHSTCGCVLCALAMASIFAVVACGGSDKPASGPTDQGSAKSSEQAETSGTASREPAPLKAEPLAKETTPPPDEAAIPEKKPDKKNFSVSVTTGKSCEKAVEENPQTLDIGKGGGQRDLTDSELGAPLQNGQFMASCGLADSANAEICVAVKNGKPLGVTVKVSPPNGKVAACIEKATRRVLFPTNPKLDVVHTRF